jgi:heme/copper-type cytochrome/quinol oxidase subunit 2
MISSSSFPLWSIILIAIVGAFTFVASLVFLILFFRRKNNNNNNNNNDDNTIGKSTLIILNLF